MKIKNFYIVIERRGEEGIYSYVLKHSNHNNLYSTLKSIPNILTATIMATKKEAIEMVQEKTILFLINTHYFKERKK